MSVLKKTSITILFCLMSLVTFAQKNDTTFVCQFSVYEDATLELDFQYTDLNIVSADNDSLKIETHINVTRTNTSTAFGDVELYSTQSYDSLSVKAGVVFGNDFINYNEFKSTCTIAVPKEINLKINSRFGIVNINTAVGAVSANIDYVNFNSVSLSDAHSHKFVANYSTIDIENCNSEFTLKGTNNNFSCGTVDKLIADTKFSFVHVYNCKELNAKSYTDRFLLANSDSVHINSEKSTFVVHVNGFIQSEMLHGRLCLQNIKPSFNTINIANQYTKTSLNFDPECEFLINADMRYCQLKSEVNTFKYNDSISITEMKSLSKIVPATETMTLNEIISPNGAQYSGYYGDNTDPSSKVSIVSSNSDVIVSFDRIIEFRNE